MHERGRVITVRDGTVDVRMERDAQCGGCSACTRTPTGETVMHAVRDPFGATVGDTVDILIPDAVRSRAAAAVFIVPVLCMLLGYLAGYLLSGFVGVAPDTAGILGALGAAGIAVIGVRAAERKLGSDEQFMPRVNAIISRSYDRP